MTLYGLLSYTEESMKKHFYTYIFILLFFQTVSAKDYPFGIFITGLYNFDYIEQTFCADYWLWSLYDGEETDFQNSIDPVNDISFTSSIYSSQQLDTGQYWMQQKIQAQYQYKWDLRKFPFEVAELKIEIEDYRDISEVNFIADTVNSGVSNLITIDGWDITSFKIGNSVIEYNTNFGNSSATSESNDYSRIIACIGITRSNSWITFFKLTAGVYISILISFLPFFMKPNTDSRLSLPSAGLFAVVSNKYVVESIVPSSTSLTLLDSIHFLAMLCILLIFIVLIQTDGMRSSEEKQLIDISFRIDRIFALILATVFCIINCVLLCIFFSKAVVRV